MKTALALARRGLGKVWPNPAVGCIIVKDDRVVGRGWTQKGGRPHAETVALAQAGAGAAGSDVYVTLEPCSHVGQTPPCCDALIAAQVKRVVVAIEDPDTRVSGAGIKKLREAGIHVDLGCLAEQARALNIGFLTREASGRPMVALKLATSMDGRIALHNGHSRWITNELSRQASHQLRAKMDAILVGTNTALIDDPTLNVRLPGFDDRWQPIRIVLDARLKLPLTHKLVAGAQRQPTWLITLEDNDPDRLHAYLDAGVKVIEMEADERGMIDLSQMLRELGNLGLTRILVEGGGGVAAGLLRDGLVDEMYWFRSPSIIGGDGLMAVASMGFDHLDEIPNFHRQSVQQLGTDILEVLSVRG